MNRRFYTFIVTLCMMSTVALATDLYQDTAFISLDQSLVEMPFKQTTKRYIASDFNVINADEILKYDDGAGVLGLLQGRVPGLIGQNLRTLGNTLIVIDGIPRPLASINVHEVEQITVLKDANAAIPYGVLGANGVIMIKTKRGKRGAKHISASFESGFSVPISFPDYLGSADYMELYNEARENDGIQPLYNQEIINKTREGSYPTRYPDFDFYNSGFLKDYKPSLKFVGDFSGGGERVQYYLNVGWYRSGSLLEDRNPADNGKQQSDRLSLRSNVDFDVTPFIKAYVDIAGVFSINNSLPGDFFGDAATIRPNAYAPLIDTAFVSNKNIIQGATLIDGRYLLGGALNYVNNPYGYLALSGHRKQHDIYLQENAGIIFDLSSITQGLSFKANLSMDFGYQYGIAIQNSYAVYEPTWESDNRISNLAKHGLDVTSGVQNVLEPYQNRQTAIFTSLDYQRTFANDHAIRASLIGYADQYNQTGEFQGNKHSHIGASINYVYKNKYIADFNAAFPYSVKLSPDNRMAISPSLALSWVVSEEDFLKNSPIIDFLMIRASGGILNTDMNIPLIYTYDNIWGPTGGYGWNDGQKSNSTFGLINAGNPVLFFEKKKEMNIGVNTLLFNRSIELNATYFREHRSNLITTLTSLRPEFMGPGNPYQNYGENKYSGLELGVGWNKAFGDFKIDIRSSILLAESERIKVDELWNEDYLYRAGRSTSAVFGLESLGFFEDEADIANSPDQSAFGTTIRPGDIKYKDQNNDGRIDINDQVEIARGTPNLHGNIPVLLKYKNFSLFALGSWQTGASSFTQTPYYWLFGDRKYSVLAKDRWTPDTHDTAAYPRLSSGANNNNFQTSTFWMYDNSRFSIERLQLGYDLPSKLIESLPLKGFNVYLRASNVALFSKHRDVMQLNTGWEPSYRFYAIGFKAQF